TYNHFFYLTATVAQTTDNTTGTPLYSFPASNILDFINLVLIAWPSDEWAAITNDLSFLNTTYGLLHLFIVNELRLHQNVQKVHSLKVQAKLPRASTGVTL
ncbi:hypothetical protein TYRP_014397, partial [Tyrophagus putrescentiae]